MKARVSLALSEKNNAELLADADHIVAEISGNPIFAESPIAAKAEIVRGVAGSLRTTMSAPLSVTHSRELALSREALENQLDALAGLVEEKANDTSLNLAARENIILAAGMKLRMHASPSPRVFSAHCGELPGTAILTASTASHSARAHEWKMAADISQLGDSIRLESTTKAKLEISGLARFKEYAFFHRPIIAGQQAEWEGPIFLTVV